MSNMPVLVCKNSLISPGEQVEITITDTARRVDVYLYRNYLINGRSNPEKLIVNWKDKQGSCIGSVHIDGLTAGSHMVVFRGEFGERRQYIGCVDESMAILNIFAQFTQIPNRMEDFLKKTAVIRESFLPFSAMIHMEGETAALAYLQENQGELFPQCFPLNLKNSMQEFNYRGDNWWQYDKHEIKEVMRFYRNKWAEKGLGELNHLGGYVPGNAFIEACSEEGIRYIHGFCSPTRIHDGRWKIDHMGMPMSPYIIGKEDFRKPGSDGTNQVLGASMMLRNPFLCFDYCGDYGAMDATNMIMYERSNEGGAEPHRSYEECEVILNSSNRDGAPLMFYLNLQYFAQNLSLFQNDQLVSYMVDKAAAGRLVFASLESIHEYMKKRNMKVIPQLVYWTDTFIGNSISMKQPVSPDCISMENDRFQSVTLEDEVLPHYYFDYSKKWDYPEWKEGHDGVIENKLPEGIQADVLQGTDNIITVRITTPSDLVEVPVTLWKLPGIPAHDKITFRTGESHICRYRFVQCGFSNRVALVLVMSLQEGENVVEIEWTPDKQEMSQSLSAEGYKQLLPLSFFKTQRGHYTYISKNTESKMAILLELLPATHPRRVEFIDGEFILPPGKTMLEVTLTHRRTWARIWYTTPEEVRIVNEKELAHAEYLKTKLELKLAAEDFQEAGQLEEAVEAWFKGSGNWGTVFTNRRAYRDVLSETLADGFQKQVNAWFENNFPVSGEVIYSLHPYRKAAPGTRWHHRVPEYDMGKTENLRMDDAMIDYGEAYDFGYTGWIMPKGLSISLSGLQSYAGKRMKIYLHAYDYNKIGMCYNVYLSLINGTEHPAYKAMVCESWGLPQGRSGRDDPSSVVSFELPEKYLDSGNVTIWLTAAATKNPSNWIYEGAYSTMLADLWVTVENDE